MTGSGVVHSGIDDGHEVTRPMSVAIIGGPSNEGSLAVRENSNA